MRLEAGQVAVVTGAASGIGRALVEAFSDRGLHVAALDVEDGPLTDVPAEYTAACDVSDAARLAAIRDEVLDRFGRVDVLCNNAGVIGPRVPTWEQAPDDWRWVLDVNLWGVINGIQAFLPTMVAQGSGHVVNTSSIAGLGPVPTGGNAPYVASKYGVVGISENLAEEFATAAPGLGVTVVCPGPVATRILEADRNRPVELGGGGERLALKFSNPSERISAADVAVQVLAAIEANQLFLLPSPGTSAAVRARSERLHKDLPE